MFRTEIVIAGRVFHWHSRHYYHNNAVKMAARMRRRGLYARVIGGTDVYIARKGEVNETN